MEREMLTKPLKKEPKMFPADFHAFIHKQAGRVIGENGMVGTAVVLFEFMDEDGKLGYSMLRPPETSWPETMELLTNAAETLVAAFEENRGFKHDGDEQDDL